MLRELLDTTCREIERALAEPRAGFGPREIGTVVDVGGGVARVRGLPGVRSEELVEFRGGLTGIAIDIGPQLTGVVLLGPSEALSAGADARSLGRLVDVPVGDRLLGRVLDVAGSPLDGGGPIAASARRPVEREAPAIMDRAPVGVPLATGLKVVDALVPIGRGQRELIVGDRQTGKTTIAVDAILNQRGSDVVCVYCAIGQRGTAVARVVETLIEHDALDYTVVLVAAGDDAPGLQFVTPYAATTIAEHYMERGRDVLIVYDDLTRHARAYRELSLLLRRPPGREAFPGDIFYVHSRLLERATCLRPELGGGSLTALPIIETQGQDLSAYIPTNLISITDGQIYVSPELFRKGMLPAVDVGRSVSRVGGKAQLPAYGEVGAALRLAYAQFEELETFARFATRLDEATRATIERGRRVREVLKQPEHTPAAPGEQLAILRAAVSGQLDALPLEALGRIESLLQRRLRAERPDLLDRLASPAGPAAPDWQALEALTRATVAAATGKAD